MNLAEHGASEHVRKARDGRFYTNQEFLRYHCDARGAVSWNRAEAEPWGASEPSSATEVRTLPDPSSSAEHGASDLVRKAILQYYGEAGGEVAWNRINAEPGGASEPTSATEASTCPAHVKASRYYGP